MKKMLCLSLAFLLVCGCSGVTDAKEQTPQNEKFRGVWISCYELDNLLAGGNFKEEFSAACKNLESLCITDAFVHMRAFSDSLFPSEYYTQKENTLIYDFDVLEYMITELAAHGVRTHAWINPFRKEAGVFDDPADTSVRVAVLGGIREIIERYPVAGVHFDDYFYPEGNDEIDSKSYEEYRKDAACPLSKEDWRTANINALVFSASNTIHKYNKKLIFSISPAADIKRNKEKYFADVEAWCRSGVIDLIIPQLYFGFDYPDKKFAFKNLLYEWKKLLRGTSARMAIGLAAYKLGSDTPPDGAEWQSGEEILPRQTDLCLKDAALSGVCYFSYSYLFKDDPLHTASLNKTRNILNGKDK